MHHPDAQPTSTGRPDSAERPRSRSRRRFLAATAGAAALGAFAGCSGRRDDTGGSPTPSGGNPTPTPDEGTPTPEDDYFDAGATVGLELVAEDLVLPNLMALTPDGQRYVADQEGVVYPLDADGLGDPFLDVTDRVIELGSDLPAWAAADERGFLGLAFHPDFASNGRVYVRYSTPLRAGDPEGYDHREILSEFRAPGDRSTADPDSERVLFDFIWERPIHQAGTLQFGPDGYLYGSLGDGLNPWNGQIITETLQGGIYRIDVDSRTDGKPYGIPADNPLVGREGLDEYFAWGLRNPWKMAFDEDGRLLVGDVGQALYEEINVVEKGGNYGWPIREGLACHDPTRPGQPPESCASTSERGEPLVDPVVTFPHFDEAQNPVGFAIIGGHTYAGSAVPALEGTYVFGVYTSAFDRPAGRVLTATPQSEGQWPVEELSFDTDDGELGMNVLAIGQDADGELYVLGTTAPVGQGIEGSRSGRVYRVVSA